LTASFLEVNPEQKKLVLSQRDAMRAVAMNQIQEGNLMSGVIVNLKPYGVFVDIDGVTGLLHIKEVSNTNIEALTNVFKVGQQIKVIIKNIDEYTNRMSLSTKFLEEYPGELVENFDRVMDNAEERWEKAKAAEN
jgi:small subunit ribosomal protein S1